MCITLKIRLPKGITPGSAAHKLMSMIDEQQPEWKVDAASATLPRSKKA